MPLAALLLALAAAVLHAGWNLTLARARDVEAATALVLALSVVLFAPVAAATWDVHAAAIPFAAASAGFELAYVALLAAAYTHAELSVVYPVARGAAPVLVLVAGAVVLSNGTSAAEVVGVVVVGVGIFVVRGVRAGRGVGLGLAVACCIAGYTLVDSRGIRHADPFGYLEIVLPGPAVVYLAITAWRKGRRTLRAELRVATIAAAAASFGAYALVLAALRLASAASVAAVRETSIVIAVALARVFLRERVGPVRFAGAVLVAAGVALLSL